MSVTQTAPSCITDTVRISVNGENRMKGYIRLGVYSRIKKEQHGRITKTQFIHLSREEMMVFRNESQNMDLIQIGETIEELIGESVSPTYTSRE